MELTALQSYEIEQALIKGRTIDAVKIYREAIACDLAEAKFAVDLIAAELRAQKPWYFKDQNSSEKNHASGPVSTGGNVPAKSSFRRLFIIAFVLADFAVFGALAYYFILQDSRDNLEQASSEAKAAHTEITETASLSSEGRPKKVILRERIGQADFHHDLDVSDSFESLYREKIDSASYSLRKRFSSQSYDSSDIEKQIKTARSALAARRAAPEGAPITRINWGGSQPSIDGLMEASEWSGATVLMVDETLATRVLLKTDGEWLYIACDTPGEKTGGGYDQLRVYFHAGLIDGLVNERIHVGRGEGVTSIRQTRYRWLGKAPSDDSERWKKYAINDWGLYQFAVGASSMISGHRQYEAAVHLGETGLHAGTPFTVYVEVETDPLKNEQGKFVERQYLGELGNRQNPVWMVF